MLDRVCDRPREISDIDIRFTDNWFAFTYTHVRTFYSFVRLFLTEIALRAYKMFWDKFVR